MEQTMYQNTFETLAVETTLTSRQAIKNEKWQEIGKFFLQSYIEQIGKTETVVIGHIKGLIELGDENFIKLSCTSQNQPINSEIITADGSSRAGRLTFNGIVSGVPKDKSIQYFHMALERTCSVFELLTDYRETVHGDSKCDEKEDEVCPVCHRHHHHHDETCGHQH